MNYNNDGLNLPEVDETPEETAILDKIDAWHMEAPGTEDVELHEYLGWTWEQYKTYVETGKIPNG